MNSFAYDYTKPHDVVTVVDAKVITQNSNPVALIKSFVYSGPAKTFYLLALIGFPGGESYGSIKFVASQSVPIQLTTAYANPTTITPNPSISIPMVQVGSYQTGSCDGVILVMDAPTTQSNVIYFVVYQGQYKLT